MSPARVLRGLILGALGGALGWLIVEPIPFLTTDPTPGNPQEVSQNATVLLGGIVGGCIGAALGVAEGILAGTRPKFQRAVLLGAVIGVLGGCLGLAVGQHLFNVVLQAAGIGGDLQPRTPVQFFLLLIARTLGWTLFGTLIGFSVGVPTQSPRKMRHGFIGGMFGGALGGFSFQTLAQISSTLPLFSGEVLRLIGFTSIGGACGFFVSLVSEAFKQAWVKVLVGRNEGREHVLEKAENVIGRDELVEVPVFGATAVARRHAVIVQEGGRHMLRDEGAPGGTLVNGQPVTQQLLQDGDEIRVGNVAMVFYEKATASPHRRRVDAPRSPLSAPPPVGANVCPYCGSARDPLTGACACTVAPEPALGAPGPQASPSPAEWGAWPAAPAGGGEPRLVVLAGPYAGQQFPLGAAEMTIGREPGRDIALVNDPTTSRRHAVLVAQDGGFLLRDAGSANGTWVNGSRITEQPLRPGDEIRIGGNQFRFEA